MKKPIWFVLSLVLVVGFIAVGCGQTEGTTSSTAASTAEPTTQPTDTTAPSAGEVVELRFAHGWSTEHHIHKVIEAWTKEVEEATSGRVKIEIYPGGALATPNQLYDAVATGVADMAWFLQGYTAGKFPLTSVIELPFMAESAEQASQALWDLYEKFPEFQEEYQGVRVLWMWTTDTGQLMTTDKEIKTLNDVAGLKLRVGSASLSPTTEAFGAVPILMPINELYDSLQKGVVEGTLLSSSAVKTFNLQDVIAYMSMGNFFVNTQSVAINDASWAKISSEDQKVIQDLSGKRMAQITGKNFDTEGKAGFEAAVAGGVQIIELSEEELQNWRDAVSDLNSQWIADMNSKGLPGQEVFDEALTLTQQYR